MTYEIPISKKHAKIGLFGIGLISLIIFIGGNLGSGSVNAGSVLCLILAVVLGIMFPLVQLLVWGMNDEFPFHFRENED